MRDSKRQEFSLVSASCVGDSRTLLRESVLKLSRFDRVNDEKDDGTQWREVPKNKIILWRLMMSQLNPLDSN